MQRWCLGIVAIVLVMVSSIGAASASAATEFGDNCAANGGAANYTFVGLTAPGNPLSLTAPVSGVITQWKTNVALAEVPAGLSEALTVLRPAGGSLQFTVVGQSPSTPIANGQNSFNTRIPVQAGDRLGLAGSFAPLYCQTGNTADSMGILNSVVSPGSTNTFTSTPTYQVPVSAVIEPDADGDGFGDETQDKCPQSATTQAPCPVVTLNTSAGAHKGLASVVVTSSAQASVTVGGTVKLGKGKVATLSGGTQVVAPGALAKFTLLFPAKLKAKLKQLSPKQHLTLSIAATAPNVVGAATTSSLTLKLKGQAKPKRKHRK